MIYANKNFLLRPKTCTQSDFYVFGGRREYRQITLPAHGGTEGSVRLLLTKNPTLQLLLAKDRVSRLNGSRGPCRLKATSALPPTTLVGYQNVNTVMPAIKRLRPVLFATLMYFTVVKLR